MEHWTISSLLSSCLSLNDGTHTSEKWSRFLLPSPKGGVGSPRDAAQSLFSPWLRCRRRTDSLHHLSAEFRWRAPHFCFRLPHLSLSCMVLPKTWKRAATNPPAFSAARSCNDMRPMTYNDGQAKAKWHRRRQIGNSGSHKMPRDSCYGAASLNL